MKQSNLNNFPSTNSANLLLAGMIIVVLSGCAGTGIAPYVIGAAGIASPYLPKAVRKTLPYAFQGVAYVDSLAEKKRQEELQRQNEEERRAVLANMTPQQRAEFRRAEQQRVERGEPAAALIIACIIGLCDNGSSQGSGNQSSEDYMRDGIENSRRNEAIWARQQAEINRQVNHH